MHQPLLAAAALSLAVALSGCLPATNSAERVETTTVAGIVQSINPASRRFVVETPESTIRYRASPAVRNFDQIKVGDKVQLNHYDFIAVSMAAPGDPGDRRVERFGQRAPAGKSPATMGGEVESMVVDLISYDREEKIANIRMPDGSYRHVNVPREFWSFAASRKPEDRVLVVIEDALAVSIIPSK
ncbi:hypothetical protein RGUI_1648 [Rhodovulum sp. P5]|uniref:hypothetical protein n=1 Tax=Rhodovulum sp. P5 TaxID=1564506 RepID=UPI0009C207A3|nr:hypothetical protein [Rhodovulum sp. P5]ARE39789.1 hypothetical protein RGUI_1648 [Rhodovulum sp. P5]